ncbi:MAG: hypothetical protein JWO43_176 [Candidatus Adlerbacteria bacterium]|nr:hypothetical protein [Candidatus Adlerbacteria bacterium]
MDAGTKKVLIWAGVILLFVWIVLPSLKESGGIAGIVQGTISGGGPVARGAPSSAKPYGSSYPACIGKQHGTRITTPDGTVVC